MTASNSHQTDTAYDVIIVGGGLSGLSAAVELAGRGQRIILLEQGPRLGGRCYSFLDGKTGDVIDNGQHILVGAYHDTLRYLERIGSIGCLKRYPSLCLPFFHPQKGFAEFILPSLPRPLQLTVGLLKFKLLSFQDRRRLLAVGVALQRWSTSKEKSTEGLSVAEWLKRLNQTENILQSLWYPITVAIMNESPDRASATLFARTLKATLFGSGSDSTILMPMVGQTELYVHGAQRLLSKANAHVACNSAVAKVVVKASQVVGVSLKNGDRILGRNIICAVPYFSLPPLLPTAVSAGNNLELIDRIPSSPIISLHLWFDRDFMEQDYLGLIGKSLQWVFNRRRIIASKGKHEAYISAVISGAQRFIDLSNDRLIDLALRDLRDVFVRSGRARLISSVVIKEKRATFSPRPEVEALRPTTRTNVKGLFLAGDWTDTGLPATIEGAIRSGLEAANQITRTESSQKGSE